MYILGKLLVYYAQYLCVLHKSTGCSAYLQKISSKSIVKATLRYALGQLPLSLKIKSPAQVLTANRI